MIAGGPRMELLAPRRQAALATRPRLKMSSVDGSPRTLVHRAAGGYLLRFPDLADFEAPDATRVVRCHPAPGTQPQTCEHLFLNQVLPLLLSGGEKLVFHASAVCVEVGAIAFLGESGRGKSTLAAAFASTGHAFLTDEALVLEARRGRFQLLPGHPSLRLWRDSQEAIAVAAARSAPPMPCSDKTRLQAGPGLPFCADARPLRAAYFLGEGEARAPAITPLRPADAVAQWLGNSFLLDPQRRDRLAGHFARVAELAGRVPALRLDFPRDFRSLDRVRQCVLSHCRQAGAAG